MRTVVRMQGGRRRKNDQFVSGKEVFGVIKFLPDENRKYTMSNCKNKPINNFLKRLNRQSESYPRKSRWRWQ